MILGFTGTRKGITAAQSRMLRETLADPLMETARVLHGGAIGADTEFDQIVSAVFEFVHYDFPEDGIVCEVYPATVDRFSFWRWRDHDSRFVHSPMEPLKRNRIIVNRSDRMIATPSEDDEQPRGGTWSTIRYTLRIGKPIVIISPRGGIIATDTLARRGG